MSLVSVWAAAVARDVLTLVPWALRQQCDLLSILTGIFASIASVKWTVMEFSLKEEVKSKGELSSPVICIRSISATTAWNSQHVQPICFASKVEVLASVPLKWQSNKFEY